MKLIFNPITGNLDYVTDSTDWIARDGTTTTTAAIPFALGASFGGSSIIETTGAGYASLNISGKAGGIGDSQGGNVFVKAGDQLNAGDGGSVQIWAGQCDTGAAGDIILKTFNGDTNGIVAVVPAATDIPAGVRGSYAFYVKGAIYSDNLSASTMVKADSNKGLVAATPSVDYVVPSDIKPAPQFTYFV